MASFKTLSAICAFIASALFDRTYKIQQTARSTTSKMWRNWKYFTGCERWVISKFFVSKWCILHRQSLRGNLKYSFNEVLIHWSTHSVKYSFREVFTQLSTQSVKLRTAWIGKKESKFIWTVRSPLWYSYALLTQAQMGFICHFQTTISRLILIYDLWTIEQKVFIFY